MSIAADKEALLGDSAIEGMRAIAQDIMDGTGANGRRWCDKSLTNWEQPELLLKIWPDAKFLCLHRNIMDFIASGIEAAPWGYQAFGFLPYIAKHPDNFPMGLAIYWLDRTRSILEFEQKNPDIACGIRYEDLVTDPETVASGIWEFLDLDPYPGVVGTMFDEPRSWGSSDHKVVFTRDVTASSVGRGTTVPIHSLPVVLLEEVNDVLGKLDYRTIDDSWGRYDGVSPNVGEVGSGTQESYLVSPSNNLSASHTEEMLPREVARCRNSVEQLVNIGILDQISPRQPVEIRIVHGHSVLLSRKLAGFAHIRIDRDSPHGSIGGESVALLVITWNALLTALAGTCDIATSMTRGEVRYFSPESNRDLDPTQQEDLRVIVSSLNSALSRVEIEFAANPSIE